MPDVGQLTEVLTAQLITTLQAPLIEIASCFQNNQEDDDDGDWSWDAISITEAIFPILERLGVIHRCEECGYDFAWANTTPPGSGDCPNWDGHSCEGGCGNSNDECTCDCECPVCENCEYVTSECTCTEAERIWPANA